jgi:DNA-binding NtrC family response regulator
MTEKKQRTRLLLVDDDVAMLRLLTRVISASFADQIEIEALTDPNEAKERLQDGRVDILVTDLEMPGVSGLELLRCAKSRNATTQVLLITGHSTRGALLNALEFGATDYLLKPVDRTELVELIQETLARQQRWRQALLGTWHSNRKKPDLVLSEDY